MSDCDCSTLAVDMENPDQKIITISLEIIVWYIILVKLI